MKTEIVHKPGRIEFGEAFLNYEQGEGETVLELVFVPVSEQGKGIGRTLVEELISLDLGKIALYAEPQSKGLAFDALVEFYESFGFEPDSACGGLPFMARC